VGGLLASSRAKKKGVDLTGEWNAGLPDVLAYKNPYLGPLLKALERKN
jgi:hypothetical protein